MLIHLRLVIVEPVGPFRRYGGASVVDGTWD